jgi:hypothetical protein
MKRFRFVPRIASVVQIQQKLADGTLTEPKLKVLGWGVGGIEATVAPNFFVFPVSGETEYLKEINACGLVVSWLEDHTQVEAQIAWEIKEQRLRKSAAWALSRVV